jgi:hypothetical protein
MLFIKVSTELWVMGRGKGKKKTGKPGFKGKGSIGKASGQISGSLLESARCGDFEAVADGIQGPAEAAALIEILSREPTPMVSMIAAISARFSGRDVKKSLNRAVFVLKKRGVPVDAFNMPMGVDTEKSSKISSGDKAEAYVGPFDAGWYRPVLVNRPRPGQGVDLAVGIVSDEEGFHDFVFGTRNRKDARTAKDLLSEKSGGLVLTSVAHAVALFEGAYRCHKEAGTPVPAAYLDVRPQLREAARADEPEDISTAVHGNESLPLLTFNSVAKLFSHPLMDSWRLPPAVVQAFSDAVAEVKSSPLILSEVQRRERILSLAEPRLKALFSPEALMLFVRRLKETAFLFAGRGEDEYHRLCSAAAADLDALESGFSENPVLALLIERSLGNKRAVENDLNKLILNH